MAATFHSQSSYNQDNTQIEAEAVTFRKAAKSGLVHQYRIVWIGIPRETPRFLQICLNDRLSGTIEIILILLNSNLLIKVSPCLTIFREFVFRLCT